METSELFSQLVNRSGDSSGGIITGTAVTDSADGMVTVQMDGSTVAQPGEDEQVLEVPASDFADGTYQLPSVPYSGSLTVTDANGDQLEEQDYELDGARLTIFALSSAPVEVAYETSAQLELTNEDFDGDSYSLASTTNLTVTEMDSEGAWNPATYSLDGSVLTIDGIEHVSGIVEFTYVHDVSQVCEPGENVLPDAPDEVSVLGRDSSGTDVVVTDYELDGNVITLPSTYDAYTVDYPVTLTEVWNVSDQYQDEPLEDSEDAADPTVATIGHDLQWPPDAVTSCTIDGETATYTLDVANVVVDAPTITHRYFRLTYDAPVALEVPASSFATGAYTLPSVPLGTVAATMGGTVLESTVDDDQLSIPSLVADSTTYSIAYTEQVEQDVVELPCTPYVAEGQFVEVAVVNGMPTVIGASGSGDVTMTLAVDASDAAAAAEDAAQAAQEVAEATNQHFWQRSDNPDGAGSGAFVTEVPQEEFTDQDSANYQSGANSLWNSLGMLFRTGLNNLLALVTGSDPGVAIYDGLGNLASNIVARFTGSGLVLGRSTESHAEIDYHSLQLIDKEGMSYLYVSDLRDDTGYASIVETFAGGPGITSFTLQLEPEEETISVKVDGADVTWTLNYYTVILDDATPDGSEVVIAYETTSDLAKAYTMGRRDATAAVGPMSLAEGVRTAATMLGAHAEGAGTVASSYMAHAEGNSTHAIGNSSHSEGDSTYAEGIASHAEGCGTAAKDMYGHAEGYQTQAGKGAHAEGETTFAFADFSHAEGGGTRAEGSYSHAEGSNSQAIGDLSHAEGENTYASGTASHAEGDNSEARGDYSHAEGASNASGNYSHAEGSSTYAGGLNSHAQNYNTVANGDNQTALGRHNVADTTSAVIIGNGTTSARSNALTVDWSGNVEAAGGATLTGNLTSANLGGAYYSGDMNDLVIPGIYYVAGASTNLPVASGSMVWLTVSENIVMQVCIVRQNNYDTYVRQRTASGNWGAWARVGGKKVTDWVSLGNTTGTTALSFDLTNYNEVCIVARYSTAYLGSIVLPKAALHASTEYEAYLGGWGNPNTNSNRRAVAKVNRSKLTPIAVTENQTDRTSSATWWVYAR